MFLLYYALLQGLCGTFNNNQKDDFLTPENDIEQSVIPFANKWKTTERCNDIPDKLLENPCEVNIQNKATAEMYCSKIKTDLFKGKCRYNNKMNKCSLKCCLQIYSQSSF